MDAGITYTELVSLLDGTTPAYLETLHYDAKHPYSAGENWFDFEFDLTDPNYAGFVEAVEDGRTVTFMLLAPPDSSACFNIRAYVQNNKNGTQTIRDTGPYLKVQAALPAGAFDFDASGTVDPADLDCLIGHWKEIDPALAADIAPLGGDGVVDILDLAEFMEYWNEHRTEPAATE